MRCGFSTLYSNLPTLHIFDSSSDSKKDVNLRDSHRLLVKIFSVFCLFLSFCFCLKHQLFSKIGRYGMRVGDTFLLSSMRNRFRNIKKELEEKVNIISMPHIRAGVDEPKDKFERQTYYEKIVWAERVAISEARLKNIEDFFLRNQLVLLKYFPQWKEFERSWWGRIRSPPVEKGEPGNLSHELYLLQIKDTHIDFAIKGYKSFIERNSEIKKLIVELLVRDRTSKTIIPISN